MHLSSATVRPSPFVTLMQDFHLF